MSCGDGQFSSDGISCQACSAADCVTSIASAASSINAEAQAAAALLVALEAQAAAEVTLQAAAKAVADAAAQAANEQPVAIFAQEVTVTAPTSAAPVTDDEDA